MYWPAEVIDGLEKLADKNGTSVSFESARIIAQVLEVELDKPTPEPAPKIPLPIIDTTPPEYRVDFRKRFPPAAIDLRCLFEYMEDDNENITSEVVEKAIFLIAFESRWQGLLEKPDILFEDISISRLKAICGKFISTPQLKNQIRLAKENMKGALLEAAPPPPPPLPPPPPEPFERVRYTFENVDELISTIVSEYAATGTLIMTPLKDRGDIRYTSIAFKREENVPVLLQLRFPNTRPEAHDDSYEYDAAMVHCEAIYQHVVEMENITYSKWCKSDEEFIEIASREGLNIPADAIR